MELTSSGYHYTITLQDHFKMSECINFRNAYEQVPANASLTLDFQSVKDILNTKKDRYSLKMKELFNPMEDLFRKGLGTLAWRDGWNLFDQIIISSELMKKEYV